MIAGLRTLGRFYKDKFKLACQGHGGGGDGIHRTDFERAQYYYSRAVEKSNRADISALNDLGLLFYTAIEIKESNTEIHLFNEGELQLFRQDARKLFNESLGVCADQQRAPYNLGLTFFSEKEYKKGYVISRVPRRRRTGRCRQIERCPVIYNTI